MKLCKVLFQHLGVVARRVAGDHEWEQHFPALFRHFFVHEGHLVELVGADVGAVCKAKVDLYKGVSALFGKEKGSIYQ